MILFTTKCWEGDYQKYMGNALKNKRDDCLYNFDETWLLVNNGVPEEVLPALESKADRLIIVEDYAKEALNFFDTGDLGISYNYSIAELVELYLAKDFKYIVHFASDCKLYKPFDWITPSIELIENSQDVVTTSPNSEDSITYGLKNRFFSDQAYLAPVNVLRQRIYNYPYPELPEYPPKGGDALFERRVGRYLHNHNKFRQLIKECWLSHPSW